MKRWYLSLLIFSFLSPLYALPPQEHFVRIGEEGEQQALQVAVSRYDWKHGKTVDLVSAVHIGDKDYYQALNILFSDYDAVLYELVAPRGVKPTRVPRTDQSWLSRMQAFFADSIGASLQLEEVDYSPDNFVHADLSFKDLVAEGKRRGETLFSFLIGIFRDVLSAQEKLEELPGQPQSTLELYNLWLNKPAFRRYMAENLVMLSDKPDMIGLETLEPYILEARNKEVMKVLRRFGGMKSPEKKIAIFYGAAHMRDLEQRLLQKFKARRQSTSWLPAWNLQK